jgi:uncharacterized protein
MLLEPDEFARRHERQQGDLAPGAFERLAALGWTLIGGQFVLVGGGSGEGPWWLELKAGARLQAVCQRCLAEIEVPVEVDVHLELAASETVIDAADDDVDRIVASVPIEAATLVEDELILAAPMVARHEQCEARGGDERPAGSLSKALAAWSSRQAGRSGS